MADRTARLRVVVDEDTKGADKAAASLGRVDDAADRAGASLHSTAGEAKSFGAEIDKSRARLKELESQLLSLGNDSSLRKRIRSERSFLSELVRAAGRPGQGLALPRIGGVPGPAVAGLVGAGTLAGIPLGAMIGGAIAGATGTAAMAAGILAASKDPTVLAAAQRAGANISAEFFASGDAFADPVVEGLGTLQQAFHDLDLASLLEPLAPTVTIIAEGIADFTRNLKPGLGATLERMVPFAEAAAQGIGDMGSALGGFLDDVSGSEGAVEGLRALFGTLNAAIIITGKEIRFLEDHFHNFMTVASNLTQLAANVSPDWAGFDGLNRAVKGVASGAGEASGQIKFMGTAAGQVAKNNYDLANALGLVDENATNATASLYDFYNLQLGQVDANIAFEQSLDDMATSLKEHGRSLDIDTQKGRDNMRAIQDAINDAIAVRDKLAAQGKLEEANAAYQRMIDRIREVGRQAGLSKAEIDKLVKPYEFTITANVVVRKSSSAILSNLSGPAQDILRASGGPVKAGQPYVVGDGGKPEWFVPESNGYVFPDVPRGGSGGGGGMGDARPLVLAGGGLGELVFTWLREEVASRGGSLAVLGLRN